MAHALLLGGWAATERNAPVNGGIVLKNLVWASAAAVLFAGVMKDKEKGTSKVSNVAARMAMPRKVTAK